MSENKDALILAMFEELKKLREQNERLSSKIEELSKAPPPNVSPISLANLQEKIKNTQELSESTKETLARAVEAAIRYAKVTQFC